MFETIGPIIAAVLTLLVFSYIFGDNVLFKLAAHIFVGVAVGYAIIVVVTLSQCLIHPDQRQ